MINFNIRKSSLNRIIKFINCKFILVSE